MFYNYKLNMDSERRAVLLQEMTVRDIENKIFKLHGYDGVKM